MEPIGYKLPEGTKLENKLSEPINQTSEAVSALKRHCQSAARYHEHMRCFTKAPERTTLPTKRMMEQCPHVLDIIHNLAEQKAIIPEELNHISTWNNLSSICKDGSVSGAALLNRNGKIFDPNVLGKGDIDRGDGNVFCLAPNFIDSNAVLKEERIEIDFIDDDSSDSWEVTERREVDAMTLKKGAIRIKGDISKIEPQGRYSQFFKIKDFGCQDFLFEVKITDWLKVTFDSSKRRQELYDVTFKVNDEETDLFEVTVKKDENLFYGDLYQINRFCMLNLFKLIEKSKNTKLIDQFYEKMSKATEAEVIKILKLFGQNLTAFAEVNFHGNLELKDHFITEISDIETGKCYSLKNLSTDEYRKQISSLAASNFHSLPQSNRRDNSYGFYPDGQMKSYWGRPVYGKDMHFSDPDYSKTDPKVFCDANYVNYFEQGQRPEVPVYQKVEEKFSYVDKYPTVYDPTQ